MFKWNNILLFLIKGQKPITKPKLLLLDPSILVFNSKYRQFLAKNKEKVLNKEKNTWVKVNISYNNFSKLALTKKKDEAITMLNFIKFLSYSYLSLIKRFKKG